MKERRGPRGQLKFAKEDLREDIRESRLRFLQHRVDDIFAEADADESGELDAEEHAKMLDACARIVRQRWQAFFAIAATALVILVEVYNMSPTGWSRTDTFYYLGVTYLTVGFGDYVYPLETAGSLYGHVILFTLLTTSGVGLVAMCLSSSSVLADEVRAIFPLRASQSRFVQGMTWCLMMPGLPGLSGDMSKAPKTQATRPVTTSTGTCVNDGQYMRGVAVDASSPSAEGI